MKEAVIVAKKTVTCTDCGGTGRIGHLVHSECRGKGTRQVEDTETSRGGMPSDRWGKW